MRTCRTSSTTSRRRASRHLYTLCYRRPACARRREAQQSAGARQSARERSAFSPSLAGRRSGARGNWQRRAFTHAPPACVRVRPALPPEARRGTTSLMRAQSFTLAVITRFYPSRVSSLHRPRRQCSRRKPKVKRSAALDRVTAHRHRHRRPGTARGPLLLSAGLSCLVSSRVARPVGGGRDPPVRRGEPSGVHGGPPRPRPGTGRESQSRLTSRSRSRVSVSRGAEWGGSVCAGRTRPLRDRELRSPARCAALASCRVRAARQESERTVKHTLGMSGPVRIQEQNRTR